VRLGESRDAGWKCEQESGGEGEAVH
jgi:hypothetical protein